MAKKILLVSLLTLGMAGIALADGIPTGMDNASVGRWTVSVYNDSGSDLTSGTIVVWDNDDTEFDRSGYRYVTTTTTADSIWTAGVTVAPTCGAGQMCDIVVFGPAITRVAHSTDAITEDDLVGTTTVAGEVGAFAAAADSCNLGRAMELREAYTGATTGISNDNTPMWIFVDPSCSD